MDGSWYWTLQLNWGLSWHWGDANLPVCEVELHVTWPVGAFPVTVAVHVSE